MLENLKSVVLLLNSLYLKAVSSYHQNIHSLGDGSVAKYITNLHAN